MTHAELQEALAVYRDLRGAERKELESHVAGCPECSALLNSYRAMDRTFSVLRDSRPDNRLREGFYAVIGDKGMIPAAQPVHLTRSRLRPVMFAACAVLLLAVASAVALWQGWLPERASTIGRPFATPIPRPHSSLVRSFIFQTDGAYGYQMLRPAGWEAIDQDGSRTYVSPAASQEVGGLHLGVINYEARYGGARRDGSGVVAQLAAFEQNPTLAGWCAAMEQSWQSDGGRLQLLRSLPDARIYLLSLPDAGSLTLLLGFKVEGGQPLGISLLAGGPYADVARIQNEGVLDDFGTMIASARAVPFDPRNIVPALPEAAATPIRATPTPAPTMTPPPVVAGPAPVPSSCVATDRDTSLFASPEDGFCLLYPAAMRPGFGNAPDREAAQRLAMVRGTDPLVLSIITAPANGYTLDQVARNVVSGFPAEVVAQTKRSETRLGGEQAVILDNMPGRPAGRLALVIHGDRLYRLELSPFGDPSFAQLQPEAQTLWDTMAGSWAFIPLAQSTPAPGSAVTLPDTRVTLDAFSGLPDPTWTLPVGQDQELRSLLAALPESDCRPMDLSLGYRGFVVYLGQRPELSNEYRLRVYAGQVRWGDPWNREAPGASCRSDTGRQVERFLLAGGQSQVPEILYNSLTSEIEGTATATPAPAAERRPPVPASPGAQTPAGTPYTAR